MSFIEAQRPAKADSNFVPRNRQRDCPHLAVPHIAVSAKLNALVPERRELHVNVQI